MMKNKVIKCPLYSGLYGIGCKNICARFVHIPILLGQKHQRSLGYLFIVSPEQQVQ